MDWTGTNFEEIFSTKGKGIIIAGFFYRIFVVLIPDGLERKHLCRYLLYGGKGIIKIAFLLVDAQKLLVSFKESCKRPCCCFKYVVD